MKAKISEWLQKGKYDHQERIFRSIDFYQMKIAMKLLTLVNFKPILYCKSIGEIHPGDKMF